MKNKIIILVVLLFNGITYACPLCKKNQPKGLEDVTHGQGPVGNLDYIIMYAAIIIVGYTLIMSVRYLISPKEKESSHIKNFVKDDYNIMD